jgi:hypothetical protein
MAQTSVRENPGDDDGAERTEKKRFTWLAFPKLGAAPDEIYDERLRGN